MNRGIPHLQTSIHELLFLRILPCKAHTERWADPPRQHEIERAHVPTQIQERSFLQLQEGTFRGHDSAQGVHRRSEEVFALPRDRKSGEYLPRFQFYRVRSGPQANERIAIDENGTRGWPRQRSEFGISSVQLGARFREREPVSDAQQSIWNFCLLC
jgi:hypothetical protein